MFNQLSNLLELSIGQMALASTGYISDLLGFPGYNISIHMMLELLLAHP